MFHTLARRPLWAKSRPRPRRPAATREDAEAAVAAFMRQREMPPIAGGGMEPWEDTFPRTMTAAEQVRARLDAIEFHRTMGGS